MADEPLFFKDEGEMGDVFKTAQQIIEQTRLSRDERARVTAITEDRLKQLTGKFVEYDTLNAQNGQYRKKIHLLRVKLLKGEFTADDAKKALDALTNEREGLQKRYADLVGLLDGQMKNIDTEITSLDAREASLIRQRDQYHSSLHMEVKWIAEGELKEIAGLKENLKKKRQSLVEEKTLIFIKMDELAESFSLVEEGIDKKTGRYVSAEEARACELDFLARFDVKMHSYPVKIFSPQESMTYTVTDWKHHYHYDSDQDLEQGGKTTESATDKALPLNAGSVYTIEQKDLKFFGKSHKKIVVEAFSYCNLSDYADLGFDTRPVSMSAIMAFLRPVIQHAEAGDYYHALGIASPTGWGDPVISWVTGDGSGTSYLSRNVAVCLIDSGSGETYYNQNDLRIISYVDYFRSEFDKERVEKQKRIIRAEFDSVEYLEFEKMFEKTKEDRFIIQKAFYELEREKTGKIKFVEGVGMVFMR